MSRRTALALGAALAGGVAVGVTAQQRRWRLALLPQDAPFEGSTVLADDGTPLHVEVEGEGPLTVVLTHGYGMDLRCWNAIRAELVSEVRLVLWDHRGHGRSGMGDPGLCTIEQLGKDLGRVVDETTPTGPVVLAGHSMGGMTVMSLVRSRPDLLGRVAGVALLSTSAGHLLESTFGLPSVAGTVVRRAVPAALLLLGRTAAAVERKAGARDRWRGRGSGPSAAVIRRLSFGDHASAVMVAEVENMFLTTPVATMAAFTPTFVTHDTLDVLPAIADRPVLVLVGTKDLVTPPEHSDAIAAELPGCTHVLVAGAGHMVIMERPHEVTGHLRRLVAASLVRPR